MNALTTPDRYTRALERIYEIHVPFARHKHPLWAGLIEGRFARPQVREFLKQASIIPLYNHLYHGPLYVNCPDPEWREHIAEVVYEEGTGRMYADGIQHWKLWLRLGIGDRGMWATDFCAEAPVPGASGSVAGGVMPCGLNGSGGCADRYLQINIC